MSDLMQGNLQYIIVMPVDALDVYNIFKNMSIYVRLFLSTVGML